MARFDLTDGVALLGLLGIGVGLAWAVSLAVALIVVGGIIFVLAQVPPPRW